MAEARASKETKTMRTQIKIAFASALVLLFGAIGPQGALASFGLEAGSVDSTSNNPEGHFFPQADGHPDTVTTKFTLNTILNPDHTGGLSNDEFGLPIPDEAPLRNVTVHAPPGLIGNPTVTPRCSLAEFLGLVGLPSDQEGLVSTCSDATQVGIVYTWINIFSHHARIASPLYNLIPQPGQPALFGFRVTFSPVIAVPSIRESDYGIDFNVPDIDQTVGVTQNEFTFWGNPASTAHDEERGNRWGENFGDSCSDGRSVTPQEKSEGKVLDCPSGAPERAFLTNPSDCAHGPFEVRTEVQSWPDNAAITHTDSATVTTHDDFGNPVGVTRCDRVPFEPAIAAKPTSQLAEAPTGLDFQMDVPTAGLANPEGLSQSLLRKAVVTLPEGTTLNPSSGEGQAYCTLSQYAREKLHGDPAEGCPEASKLGSVRIDSPLLEQGEVAEGGVYLAQPNDPTRAGQENPFNSLLALYMVARLPDRGVIVKSAGKVDLDQSTGQVTTTFDELPPLPFSDFKLHFREGARAPLVTPPSCGEKTTVAKLYPYSDPTNPVEVTNAFSITNGNDGGACPKGGLPPFRPGLVAGSINNAAGRFSPFNVRLFRQDNEQEITHFSIKLPPGITGKLAGVPFCSNQAIALAKSRERIGGGKEEQLSPSCPAASAVGKTLVGAGVGSVLTYIPGKVYLAGPYHGAPLSIVAVTAGVVGPFDIGTVEVREALQINPETGEVFIDATGSDPIPHIVDGVTTHIRDLRSYVDRPNFTLNPTDCDRTQTASTVLGSGLNFASEADDNPITVATPYQAADCAALPFAPKLGLKLVGGTKRGAHPAFRARLRMHGIGEAAIERAQVTLPHSEFLENAHIKTICTRVQFKAGEGNGTACPPGSVYGHARAITPILGEALEGPVFLRSSEHQLPDLVAALHTAGGIDFDLVGRIDSVKGGGIRNTFEAAPDAPVSEFVLTMQGAKKGLLVNSTDLCKGTHKAEVSFVAHNGKRQDTRPALQAKCGAKAHKKHKRSR
jgi:hypothetical protein